jgi:hypothetical protein
MMDDALLAALLEVFFRLPAAPSFFSGVTPSGAGSAFAINQHLHSGTTNVH